MDPVATVQPSWRRAASRSACARRWARARRRAAAALPVVPRSRDRQRPVSGLLEQGRVHRAALLSAARHSVRLRSRPRHPVDAGDRRSARLQRAPARRCAMTTSRAPWCTPSSMATGSISRRCSAAGWRAPARSCSTAPTRSCRCRCIGGGCGRAASTSRPRSPRRSRVTAASRSRTARCAGSRRRSSRSGCRARERAGNVQGAFRVAPAAKAEVAGRRLILIDDVLTSGATADACARALLRAGAAAGRRAGAGPGC